MRIASLGWTLALSAMTGAALAEVETIRLSYGAPPDACPARADFEAELHARTAKASFGSEGRLFEVVIEAGEAGYVGTLAIREPDASGAERRIEGADCGEVASALALIAALAIDPDARTAPRAELELLPVPSAETVEPAPAPSAAPAPASAPVTAPTPPRPSLETDAARWGLGIGLGAAALAGPAPKVLFAFGPEAELRRQSGESVRSLGLSIHAGQTGTLGPSDARARFRLLTASVSLCPLGAEARLRWRACAVTEAGALRVEGRDVAVPGDATRLWLSAGLGARLGFRLSSRIYADAALGAQANLRRDRFVFLTPRRTVYEVPLASFSGGISAGWVLP